MVTAHIHVSTLMAKDCRKLSPSTDLQCIAITPGAILSPSTKNRNRAKTLDEEIFSNKLRDLCLDV
jgi:hypothetical protein